MNNIHLIISDELNNKKDLIDINEKERGMLSLQKYLDNILDKLAWIESRVKRANSINLYDINIHSEKFFSNLLNLVYGYNLVNLNDFEKNVHSIDLGDKNLKIAVQVTSNNTRTKIKKTIDGFIFKNYFENYERLVILIIGKKKNYTTSFDTSGHFFFSKDSDILDIDDLIKEIKTKDTQELKKISEFLDEEISEPSSKHSGINKEIFVGKMQQSAAALCRAKLTASGVPKEIVSQIIAQDIGSTKFEYILSSSEEGKTYLVGEFGSGKSHAILILAQRLMKNYLSGGYHRIPLFIQADGIAEYKTIQSFVEQNVGKGDYIIFIDGLDEIEYSAAQKIVDEINFLKELWPESRFVVGSRPMTVIPSNDDVYIQIKEMSPDERSELFSTLSELNRSDTERAFLHLDEKLDNLLLKPFFCIIYALFKAEPQSWAKTDMDLVAAFVNRAIEKLKRDKSEILSQLEKLAILSVKKNLGRIHRSELDTNVNIENLLKTGFIVPTNGDYYSFPLPIVTQWLAAEAIRHNKIPIEDIISNEESTSRWRYSLSILFSQMSFEQSKDIFSKIVNNMPGTAALIIRDGIRFGQATELPSALECGQMLRFCMDNWINALGPLSQYIAPVEKYGLYNLAIDFNDGQLTTTWANRPDEDQIVLRSFQEQRKWFSTTHSRGVPMQATWPWIVTFEYLSERLEGVVKSHSILIEDGPLESEYLWNTSRLLEGKGNLYENEIALSSVEEYREFIGSDFFCNKHKINLDLYFYLIDKLLKKGKSAIQPPYPISDKTLSQRSGFIWGGYSKQRMFEYVKFVYSNSIDEYRRLIDTCFCKLANRMPTYSLYPAEFIGDLEYDDNAADMKGGPAMTWYFSALPELKSPICKISLNIGGNRFQNEQINQWLQELHQNNIINRPNKRDWISASIHSQLLDIPSPTPVTNVVYEWLKSDLKAIGWIKI